LSEGGAAVERDPAHAADPAFQNAKLNSDRQNARIEHDKALGRAMTDVLKDDTELFKQFSDNESFRRWLTDMVFEITYEAGGMGPPSRPAADASH
jgi:type I restriction enzyme R subunit